MTDVMIVFHRLNKGWIATALALLAGIVYLVLGVYYAHALDVTMDEGTYLMKGLLYLRGDYRPFQDYGPITNKMPLAFLIPGVAQAIFEPGLRTGRYFSVFLGLLMLLGLWMVARRLGGRWWAVAILWSVAANPANIMLYTLAVSQVVVAFLLTWTFVFTLGDRLRLWQTTLGAVLSVLVVLTRQNMLPLIPVVVAYIFWQHGRQAGIWATVAAALVFFGAHALYWPNIINIWYGWMPGFLQPIFSAYHTPLGDVEGIWNPSYALLSRIYVFWEGARYNFFPLSGALFAWLLFPRLQQWKHTPHFKTALTLSLLLGVLTVSHLWASVGMDYCLYCYPGYLAFFISTGLLLVVVTFKWWERNPGWLRQALAAAIVLGSSIGIGFGAHQQIGYAILRMQVPRIRNMQFQPGTSDIWRLLANKYGWSYQDIEQLLPTIAGALFGILFLLLVGVIVVVLKRKRKTLNYGYVVAVTFFILGTLLTPTPLLGGGKRLDCEGDVIASHEAVGAHLAALIPRGSLVYWRNDVSPLPLLYIPAVRVFPPQLNHAYTYLVGGDPAVLEKRGYWNRELSVQWIKEADYLLIAARQVSTGLWQEIDEAAAQFDELTPTPLTVPCRGRSRIHIFRRIR